MSSIWKVLFGDHSRTSMRRDRRPVVAGLVSRLEDRTLLAAPVAPVFSPIVARGESWIVPQWSPVSGVTKYHLYRSVDGGQPNQIYEGPDTFRLDSGNHLIQGKTYTYSVKSSIGGVKSVAFSNERTAKLTGAGVGAAQNTLAELYTTGGVTNGFNLGINSFGKRGIDPTRNTWILIHGLNSNPSVWANAMATSLAQKYPNDTVLTIDWSMASGTGANFLAAESRIQDTASKLSSLLTQNGFKESLLQFIGHSFGSYVSHETARYMEDTTNSFVDKAKLIVALNPAANVPGGWNPESTVSGINFANVADYSWSFVDNSFGTSDVADSVVTAATAENAFIVNGNDFHKFPSSFHRIIVGNGTAANSFFRPTKLTQSRTWYTDLFDSNGTATKFGQFEGSITLDGDDIAMTCLFPSGEDQRTSAFALDPHCFYRADKPAVTQLSTGSGSQFASSMISAPMRAEPDSPSGSAATFHVSDLVVNFGTLSQAVDVVYYASSTALSTSPRYEIGRRRISGLAASSSSIGAVDFAFADVPSEVISGGRFYVGAIANPTAASTFDEILWDRVDVPIGFGTPDLVGMDFEITPYAGTYGWGQSLNASFGVSNLGTGYAVPFGVGVYLSKDSIFDSSDFLLGTVEFDGLQGGSNTGDGLNFSLPAVPPAGFVDGPAYIGMWVDSRGQVNGELSESNNQGRGSGIDFQSVSIASNVSNNGEPTIGAFTINQQTTLTVNRGVYVDLLTTGVVDNLVVNEVVFRLDSNTNGVLDSADQLVGYGSKSGTTFDTRVQTTGWLVGTYLVFAQAKDNFENLSLAAQVQVTVLGNGTATPDAYELNDSAATAHHLGGPRTYTLTNLSITEGDVDWFSFDVPAENVNLDVRALFFVEANGNGNLDMELFEQFATGPMQSVAYSNLSLSGNTQERITLSGRGTRHFFVKVLDGSSGAVHSNPNYTLSVAMTPVSGAPDVGELKSSVQTVRAGSNVDLWFDYVNATMTGNDQAIFYRDVDNNGLVDGSIDAVLGVDYGPNPNLNGKYGVTVSTAGWHIGLNYVHAWVSNFSGGSLARTIAINVIPNLPPVLDSLTAPSDGVLGDPLPLSAEAHDPDGTIQGIIFYRDLDSDGVLDAGEPSLGAGVLMGATWNLSADTTGWGVGVHSMLAIATDNEGTVSDTRSVRITLEEEIQLPPVISSIEIPQWIYRGDTFQITSQVSDPNGDPVTGGEYFRDANFDGVIGVEDTLLGNGTLVGGVWFLNINTSSLPLGDLPILVRATDSGGLASTAAVQTSVLLPVDIGLANTVNELPEHTRTLTRLKVADIRVIDDGVGTAVLSLSGADAAFFEIVGDALYVKAGTILNFETKSSYTVSVNVDDTTAGAIPDATVGYTLSLTDIPEFANVIIRDTGPTGTGNQFLALKANGTSFTVSTENVFAVGAWERFLTGDFNGDGRADIAGRLATTGGWWVSLANAAGVHQTATLWGAWNAGTTTWVAALVGDFDGDGRDDIAGRVSYGDWWVSRSTGTQLQATKWGNWSNTSTWSNTLVGDFNLDGRSDIAGRNAVGEWFVSLSTGTTPPNAAFVTSKWGTWSKTATWVDVNVGDFNGDGRSDIAGRTSTGAWWVNISKGTTFGSAVSYGSWSATTTWRTVNVGDFNGDGRDDIIGRSTIGQWWVAEATGTKFTNKLLGTWASPQTQWSEVLVGDFNRDGHADLVGRNNVTNQVWVSLWTPTVFTTSVWGTLPAPANHQWRLLKSARLNG